MAKLGLVGSVVLAGMGLWWLLGGVLLTLSVQAAVGYQTGNRPGGLDCWLGLWVGTCAGARP